MQVHATGTVLHAPGLSLQPHKRCEPWPTDHCLNPDRTGRYTRPVRASVASYLYLTVTVHVCLPKSCQRVCAPGLGISEAPTHTSQSLKCKRWWVMQRHVELGVPKLCISSVSPAV